MRTVAVFVLVTLSGVEATIGFCNDKDTSCSSWALDGECDGTNGEHVKTLCPQSCGVCTMICSDRNETCASWAKAGECATATAFMHRECPTSCGLCTPRCADIHTNCNHWAKKGQCQENPGFMNMHCPVSCGVCEGACRDTHDSCPGWSREGECVKNPGHALKACPNSCKVGKCATGKCVDHNETACAIWALDDECLKNPGMMNAECPMSCGVCSMVCQDKEEGCLSWAAKSPRERRRGERPLMSFSLCRHARGNQWRLCRCVPQESKRGLTARAGSAVRVCM